MRLRRAAHWPHTVTRAPSSRVSRSSASGTAYGRSTSSARPGTAISVASPVSHRLTSTPGGQRRGRHGEPLVEPLERLGAAGDLDDEGGRGGVHRLQRMVFHLDTSLHEQLAPLAWLVGRWAGRRPGRLPDDRVAAVRPGDRLQPRRPARSSSGARAPGCSTPTATRCARSRPRSASGARCRRTTDGTNVELLLTHPTGLRRDVRRGRRAGQGRAAHRRRHAQPGRPRSTPPATGCTATSTAT